MSDEGAESPIRCPWCSAELPAVFPPGVASACPSCGAALTSATGTEPDIRGVTTLDHEAILRARSDVSRPRGRLFSFITGDTTSTAPLKPEELASLAPPDTAVRREMLRLELEAQRAELEAESLAFRTDAVIDQGLDLVTNDASGEPTADASTEQEVDASAEPEVDASAEPTAEDAAGATGEEAGPSPHVASEDEVPGDKAPPTS
jgi:hypothetical protein